jgi:hypothetical protein
LEASDSLCTITTLLAASASEALLVVTAIAVAACIVEVAALLKSTSAPEALSVGTTALVLSARVPASTGTSV